jgi:hypothetical protein
MFISAPQQKPGPDEERGNVQAAREADFPLLHGVHHQSRE